MACSAARARPDPNRRRQAIAHKTIVGEHKAKVENIRKLSDPIVYAPIWRNGETALGKLLGQDRQLPAASLDQPFCATVGETQSKDRVPIRPNRCCRNLVPSPKLNRERALFVLTKIDEILAWEQRKEAERDTRFVELGRYLCEVRAGQYWRLENLKSFDEFLERRFPESRRKAYYLMSIHEHLPPQVRKELKEIGWTKGRELAKLARAEGHRFDCAPWVHKARSMPMDEFRREVEKELTGRDGAASRERDAQLRTISARALGPGMRTAAGQSHSQTVAILGVTAGEVTGKLRCEAIAGESESSDEGVAGRGLPGSQGELVGFWESRSG